MDMDMALKDLNREMDALEMEIRIRGGFVSTAYAPDEGREPADPWIADTRVGYFGIWE